MKLLLQALAAASLLGPLAPACDIPVFRYALERWHADPFELALTEETLADPAMKGPLEKLSETFDTNLAHGDAEEGQTEPARLLFPEDEGIAWSGPLDPDTLARITDSPARGKITAALMGGTSVVWVYVESGEAEADDRIVEQVANRLEYLESVIELPEMDPNDPSNTLGPGPELKIKFAVQRIPHDSAEEEFFIGMLRGPGADEVSEGGFFVPVFGRGRALAAIPNAEIDDALVDDASLFMVGACSCEVKHLNPGWDLLFSFDWDAGLEAAGEALFKAAHATDMVNLPPAPKSEIVATETVSIGAVEVGSTVATAAETRVSSLDTKWLLIAGAAVLALAATALGIAAARR